VARKPRHKQWRPMHACCTRTAGSVQAVPGLEWLQGRPAQSCPREELVDAGTWGLGRCLRADLVGVLCGDPHARVGPEQKTKEEKKMTGGAMMS
jgi:hypothetical protein